MLPELGLGLVEALRRLSERLVDRTDGLVVLAPDLVVPEGALAPLTDDPFVPTSMLVRPSGAGADARVRHHRVISVGTSFHSVSAPDHRSVGALVISAADGPRVSVLVAELVAALDDGSVTTDGRDLVELVAVAITRGEVALAALEIVDVPWFRGSDATAAARALVAEVPATRIAQLQANRPDDGFYSTFVIRKASKPVTRLALRLGWSPNTITLVSLAIGLAAAGAFAVGSWWALVLGAVLLQGSIVVDCVDGEVARATRRFSALGAWLDASTDRVKELAAYAGLVVGATTQDQDIWWVALALVVLQTTRHMTDYAFARIQRLREATVPVRDVRLVDDGAVGSAGGWSASGVVERSSQINRREGVRWAKRALHLPIGERWLILSVFAATLGAAWALGVLLVVGLVAFLYVTAGRTLRTLTWQGPTPEAGVELLARQADAGPILSALSLVVPEAARRRFWQHRAVWTVPGLLRFVELAVVAALVLGGFPELSGAGFLWMALVAFHHYDTLYRALQGSSTPRWLVWSGLGWDGRTVVVIVLAALGAVALRGGLVVGSVLMALLFVVLASIQWLSVQRRAGRH